MDTRSRKRLPFAYDLAVITACFVGLASVLLHDGRPPPAPAIIAGLLVGVAGVYMTMFKVWYER